MNIHALSAFLIAISFLIYKGMIKRIYKDDTIILKQVVKDSIILFGLAYLSLVFKDNLFMIQSSKAQVFTSEPNF
jgi:hypothetical protein